MARQYSGSRRATCQRKPAPRLNSHLHLSHSPHFANQRRQSNIHEPSVPWACRGRVLPHRRVRSDQCPGAQSARPEASIAVVDHTRRDTPRGDRVPRHAATHGYQHRHSVGGIADRIHAGAVRLHRLVVATAGESVRHGAAARRAHRRGIDHIERADHFERRLGRRPARAHPDLDSGLHRARDGRRPVDHPRFPGTLVAPEERDRVRQTRCRRCRRWRRCCSSCCGSV